MAYCEQVGVYRQEGGNSSETVLRYTTMSSTSNSMLRILIPETAVKNNLAEKVFNFWISDFPTSGTSRDYQIGCRELVVVLSKDGPNPSFEPVTLHGGTIAGRYGTAQTRFRRWSQTGRDPVLDESLAVGKNTVELFLSG
jgi:hypothetical protein